jgi:hypothetical protein
MLRTFLGQKNATSPPSAEGCYELSWAETCPERSWGRKMLRALLGPESWSTPTYGVRREEDDTDGTLKSAQSH